MSNLLFPFDKKYQELLELEWTFELLDFDKIYPPQQEQELEEAFNELNNLRLMFYYFE